MKENLDLADEQIRQTRRAGHLQAPPHKGGMPRVQLTSVVGDGKDNYYVTGRERKE